MLSKRMIKYFFSIIQSQHPVSKELEYFFIYSSGNQNMIGNLFSKTYDIANILENDIDALFPRIDFIERNEHEPWYEHELIFYC